ncbi:4-carboxymuconolactone decarboxylase [Halomonas sp. MCCC 1A17488]|uniref:4-carboxymuconolactone decarboxylase n=1 Tax=Billgrantia sulfidoxydans TaxID=2733484 RepID=A0ABX7W7P4_9GAMM|nr:MULTISPECIES: carboxymuconolactone decarboxylase family protein [Halomonas]MCE8017689.1 4-carboxymuconolactone decarboxylase [Halomonas sp. MCCC 1A17488]MCG3241022.1 4-carboxymuconolactone decarboxylase [Halomonas sp. MCCC 1A17488]QPP48888.1 carboxymuconolactone decarboxylase family protein [Halomonas sp. SS10-MC5]QTP56215.1 4-carboxymuconolactone decarboxylase [Halomonas sulfidoxydans]
MTSSHDRLDPDGLATRREVLGDAYVDNALAQADEFGWPLQELVTRNCWNDIWNRPGLARPTRSLVNIGMLVALNRPHELKVHLRGALNNGCSEAEIREVLLQCVPYCGFPAAMDGMRVAREVITAYHEEQAGG